ncbi:unnamed protein product [Closterium sp. NIES-53]
MTLRPSTAPQRVPLPSPPASSLPAGPDPASDSLIPLGPTPTCVPCVEGRQRAAPHSSAFPPTKAPLQTLHMDVWGPAHVRGQGHERYFLLVVDDYSRYTTVFPLLSKGDVTEVLIDWIRAARLQLRESFGSDFPVLRLHSDRGGEFSSARLGAFCRARSIRQTFTLPASPQQNGIAERRIGMVMDVARTSMIHAAAPHFLWPFAVQYAAHQLNLQPRVSVPETSPTLRWTGKVGDASVFRVWGSRATSGLGLVLGGRRPVVLTGHADASWADDQATQRSSQGYTFSLGSGSVSWRSTRSSSVLGSSCEAEIYARAMAAQELRWLTYLLTDLGEQPRSPPILYVDNKAMLALCREHRLEHRTKHIALRYFLARELQQRGQLRLAYVASEANTADIFTKALPPGDHQRFSTMLACFALLDWSCDLLFSPTLPMGVFLLVPNSLLVQSFLFLHTFAPVSRHTSGRLVICKAAAKNLPLRQIDVSNAFLYAGVDAEIYVEFPHTFSTNPPSVCKLKKSLYDDKGSYALLVVYVDDILTLVGFLG